MKVSRYTLGLTSVLLALIAVGMATASAQGATHRVCPAGPPTCDYASLQAAVDAASDGDVIQVAEGAYTTVQGHPAPAGYSGPAVITQVVYLAKSVTIRGGYAPGNWTDPDPVARPTTLDAQGLGRALVIAGEISPVIEGLRFSGGDATGLGGTSWTDAGGGVYILTATATIDQCQIYGNVAGASAWGGAGGGLYLASSKAVVQNNIIRDNTAATVGEGYGGGLALHTDDATVHSNEIYSNTASSGDWGYGGGLELYASKATLQGNEIYDNRASTADQGYGGGLYLAGGSAQVRDNIFQGNRASTEYDGYGGGFYLDKAAVTVSGNIIQGNTASAGNWSYGYGGGLDLWESNATVSANIVRNNVASGGEWGYGGGISLSRSGAVMINDAVLGNQAGGRGAGFYFSSGSPSLLHTTIAHNPGGDGSGLYIADGSAVTLTNTILVSQTVGLTVTADSRANLDGVLWGGNTDNSGGPGIITIAHAVSGDPALAADGYHLLSSSAAVDAGLDAQVTTDIDGSPRPYQLPDLGADEYWPSESPNYVYLPLVMRRSP